MNITLKILGDFQLFYYSQMKKMKNVHWYFLAALTLYYLFFWVCQSCSKLLACLYWIVPDFTNRAGAVFFPVLNSFAAWTHTLATKQAEVLNAVVKNQVLSLKCWKCYHLYCRTMQDKCKFISQNFQNWICCRCVFDASIYQILDL